MIVHDETSPEIPDIAAEISTKRSMATMSGD